MIPHEIPLTLQFVYFQPQRHPNHTDESKLSYRRTLPLTSDRNMKVKAIERVNFWPYYLTPVTT